MRIRYSRRALDQLADILSYIEHDNALASRAVAARIVQVVSLLSLRPEIGRPTDKANVRVFRVGPYPFLIFYRVDASQDELVVLRIRHTARNQDWRSGR